jgi:hypothetical protein
VPVLPRPLLSFIQSPTPFLIGIWGSELPAEVRDEMGREAMVVANLDQGTVHREASVRLPQPIAALLRQALLQTLHPSHRSLDEPCVAGSQIDPPASNFQLQQCFIRCWARLVRRYRHYLRYVRVLPKPVIVRRHTSYLFSHV